MTATRDRTPSLVPPGLAQFIATGHNPPPAGTVETNAEPRAWMTGWENLRNVVNTVATERLNQAQRHRSAAWRALGGG